MTARNRIQFYHRSHTLYQQNDLKPLINSNNSDDIEMNVDLKNGCVSRGIGLLNSHTLYQFNESSYFSELEWDV